MWLAEFCRHKATSLFALYRDAMQIHNTGSKLPHSATVQSSQIATKSEPQVELSIDHQSILYPAEKRDYNLTSSPPSQTTAMGQQAQKHKSVERSRGKLSLISSVPAVGNFPLLSSHLSTRTNEQNTPYSTRTLFTMIHPRILNRAGLR